jgi:Tol biopolymer transport system component
MEFKDRETPSGWSADGRFVIASSLRHKPGYSSIVLLPVAASPTAERRAITVTDSPDYNLWNASLSPNQAWVCFNAVTPGPKDATSASPIGTTPFAQTSKLVVVSSKGGRWIEITDSTNWDDKPRWSANGRLLYFFSDRGGLFDVWAIAFDPQKGAPIGAPFRLTTLAELGFDPSELSVANGRLALSIGNTTGGLWIVDNSRR